MRWEYDLESMESDVEEREESISEADVIDEDLFTKLSELFNVYERIVELSSFGEDMSESISILDDRFETILIKLEANYDVTKDDLDYYRAKRDEILKPYTESKGKAL